VARRETGEESVSDISTKIIIINLDRDSIATKNNKPMLTEISCRVLEHKNKITACIIKQNKRTILIFNRGDLVLFLFNTKLYFSTKLKKISCRILEHNHKVSF
jgi:hypothetical protein